MKISTILVICLSFSTGIVVASAIFAFLSVIGLIPRFITKTKTSNTIILYENIIVVAGCISALVYSFDLNFKLGNLVFWYYMISLGIFLGSLAVCLTEVIDAIPVIAKLTNLKEKVKYVILIIALSKAFGAFIFYVGGFYE